MLKNDRWITDQADAGMLEPFQNGLVRHLDPEQRQSPVLSFGCSSYGYDLRTGLCRCSGSKWRTNPF